MDDLKLRLHLEGTERIIIVEQDEFTIGRLPECSLSLPFFEISRYHVRFFKSAEGGWLVEDMGSTNGTRLNDYPLKSPQKISHGDVVHLGYIHLDVLLAEPSRPHAKQNHSSSEEMTILRNAKELQQRWIQVDNQGDDISNQQTAISRLKDLVAIAKGLNSAESIEAIFSQVKEVVFRDLKSIERLALLIDTQNSGKLELVSAAAKDASQQQNLTADGSWISRTICQRVFIDKVAIKTADAQSDSRFEGEHSILAKGIRGAFAVPLWDENKVVGVLYGDAHLSFSRWAESGEEDLSFFSTLANLVASAVQRWLLAQKLRSEETIRNKLERYHSPSVVQHIMTVKTLDNGRLTPTEADISILFADIVGFTALSERLSPVQIADLLNAFFEEMLKEVFAVGGTLDKFIGDCIMAFFGAPEPQVDHADRAVTAAKKMLDRLDYLNARKILHEPLQLRIAVNSGKAVVGDVGSSQRVDYTALGSTINLASRMQAICPPGQCIVSHATHDLLKQSKDFDGFGEYRFKGIDRPVQVYKIKRG